MATKTPAPAPTKAKKPKTPYTEPRVLKAPKYKSFRLQTRIKKTGDPLPSAFKIFRQSIGVLKRNWKLFSVLILIYGLLNIVLVRGFGNGMDVNSLKTTVNQALGGHTSSIVSGFSLFVYMLGSAGNSTGSATSGSYQLIWILIVSLVMIWTLREVYAKHKVRARDGFYRGMYPLIPFVLVLIVVALQAIPLVVGGFLYNTVASNGIAASTFEKSLWFSVMALLGLVSVYMIASSVFALYISCLPEMTPMKALRSARQLVLYRRWSVIRKIVFLPVALIVVGAIIMIPLITWAAPLAAWMLFVLTMVGLAALHSYMYALYRELL